MPVEDVGVSEASLQFHSSASTLSSKRPSRNPEPRSRLLIFSEEIADKSLGAFSRSTSMPREAAPILLRMLGRTLRMLRRTPKNTHYFEKKKKTQF